MYVHADSQLTACSYVTTMHIACKVLWYMLPVNYDKPHTNNGNAEHCSITGTQKVDKIEE